MKPQFRMKKLPKQITNQEWWNKFRWWEKLMYRWFPRWWTCRELRKCKKDPMYFFNRYIKILSKDEKERISTKRTVGFGVGSAFPQIDTGLDRVSHSEHPYLGGCIIIDPKTLKRGICTEIPLNP